MRASVWYCDGLFHYKFGGRKKNRRNTPLPAPFIIADFTRWRGSRVIPSLVNSSAFVWQRPSPRFSLLSIVVLSSERKDWRAKMDRNYLSPANSWAGSRAFLKLGSLRQLKKMLWNAVLLFSGTLFSWTYYNVVLVGCSRHVCLCFELFVCLFWVRYFGSGFVFLQVQGSRERGVKMIHVLSKILGRKK